MTLCTVAVLSTVAAARASAETFIFGSLPITVPDGFVVEQVASPPLVERPVTVAFDELGRLYVTESSGSNAPLAEQQADPQHRVLCLEDVDGDGFFDRRTIFADGLMMLQGSLWHAGSLYVAAAPEILRLTDTDGDGVADERVVWHDGGTLTGCGNDLHGPALGPDGRICFTKGAFAEQTHDLVVRPGWTTRASHLFRCRPDGSELESVLTGGMDNPVDVAFTASGERLLSATFLEHPSGGLRDGVVHAVYGGVYGKEHGVLDGHPRTGDLLPVLLPLGPAAACGLHVHSGFGFEANPSEQVFVCSFNLRSVTRHRLTPAGGSYAVTSEPFLTADSADFHPTDVIEDADGSLLVVDTGGWYTLCCPTSQLEKPEVPGAVYRIRRRGAPPVTDPRGLGIAWGRLESRQLTALLADPRPAVAWRAVETLARRSEAAPLVDMLTAGRSTVAARLRAVWSLSRIDTGEARAAIRQAMHDPAAAVRQAAAHGAGLHRDRDAVPALVKLLEGDDGGPARAAAEALGRIGGVEAVAGLLSGSVRATDRFLVHSVAYGLIEAGLPEPLLAATGAESPRERQVAMIAIDQMPLHDPRTTIDEELLRKRVIDALRDGDAALRDTALWIVSRHPAWADAMADEVPSLLGAAAAARGAGGTAVREADRLIARLTAVAVSPRVAAVLADACLDPDAFPLGSDMVAVDVMRAAGPQEVPDCWVDALGSLLGRDVLAEETRPPLPSWSRVPGAVATLADLHLTAAQRQRLRPRLMQIAMADDLPAAVSLRAIAAGAEGGPLPATVVERLVAILAGEVAASPMDRAAAGDTLAAAPLPSDALERLAVQLSRLPPAEVAKLLPQLARPANPIAATALESLSVHPHLESLPREAVAELVAMLPTAIREELGEPLLASLDAARESQRAGYDALIASLPEGDASRGHRVFLSEKAACITCHAMAYAGGRIGPDLTRIGSIRTKADLLEAILLPSSSFVRSYEPVTVLRTDGRVVSGIIQEERAHEVVVQTSAAARETVSREAIEAIEPGTASLMPAGYEKLLSPQEIADLVAFLERAR